MAISAQKILEWYECGIIVAEQCVDELCKIAAATDPRSFADVIPPEFIGRIRERTLDIPEAVECRYFTIGTYSASQYSEERKRQLDFEKVQLELEKVQYGEGLRTWKVYFESVDRVNYEDYVRREIEIGMRQIENGEGIPHEEVKRRFAEKYKGIGVSPIIEDKDQAGELP